MGLCAGFYSNLDGVDLPVFDCINYLSTRITPNISPAQGSYFLPSSGELFLRGCQKGGSYLRGGVIRGMGSYYFVPVILLFNFDLLKVG